MILCRVRNCAFRMGKEEDATVAMDAWVTEPLEREPSPKYPSIPSP